MAAELLRTSGPRCSRIRADAELHSPESCASKAGRGSGRLHVFLRQHIPSSGRGTREAKACLSRGRAYAGLKARTTQIVGRSSEERNPMIDLTTNYLGLKLKNPVVVSAGPMSEKLENFPRMEEAGAAAIVMYSLFEEQIEAESENIDSALEYGANSYAESMSYLPDMPKYHVGPDRYL